MALHSAESLKSMRKEDLIELLLNTEEKQSETKVSLDNILNQVSLLNSKICDQNQRIDELTSILAVNKAVNNELQKRITTLERLCNANAQYARRETLEIVGIPVSVQDNDLENSVIEIFNTIAVPASAFDFHACHRIKGNKTIVKFTHRKHAIDVSKNKHKLKGAKFTEKSVLNGKKIYINDSLCPNYRFLWSKCNELRKAGKIHTVRTNNGTVNIKLNENSPKSVITHITDLQNLFPNHDFKSEKKD